MSPVSEGDSPDTKLIFPPTLEFVLPLDTNASPPLLRVDCPTDTSILPPLPLFVPCPLDIPISPLEPELEVPERKDNDPLTPVVPAFGDKMNIDPLELAELNPVDMNIVPPLEVVEIPLLTIIDPPTSPVAVVAPVSMRTAPELPTFDAPVSRVTLPDDPHELDPDLKVIIPLTPLVPPLDDSIRTLPLDPNWLRPADI